jgi:hypothetical protein
VTANEVARRREISQYFFCAKKHESTTSNEGSTEVETRQQPRVGRCLLVLSDSKSSRLTKVGLLGPSVSRARKDRERERRATDAGYNLLNHTARVPPYKHSILFFPAINVVVDSTGWYL